MTRFGRPHFQHVGDLKIFQFRALPWTMRPKRLKEEDVEERKKEGGEEVFGEGGEWFLVEATGE